MASRRKFRDIRRMKRDEDDITLLVAAIDFGTTFTGYAFSTVTTKMDVRMNKNWGQEFGHMSYKAPTCVLTDPSGRFKSFGYKAEDDYFQLSTEERQGDGQNTYNLFRNFKMLLHDYTITKTTKISSATGTKMLATDIFAMALRFLKGHMLEAINNALNSPVDDSAIMWVLTVPAIWKDDAKQFMREACFKADLIKHVMSEKLTIALEPEAASLYCRNLDLGGFHGDTIEGETVYFGKNDNYMIVDAGGGTVDITCHHLNQKGCVTEICAPSGGPWGGIYVDANFEKLLEEIFSADFIKKLKKNNPRDWKELVMNFEKTKASIKSSSKTGINLTVSHSLGQAVKKHFNGQRIDKLINAKKDLGVSFRNGALAITQDTAKTLFSPVIDRLVRHLKQLDEEHFKRTKLQYVVLVGGFAQSELLQEAVKELFKSKSKVLIPMEPQLAIVKGAVIFGHEPTAISSRIAKVTYGIEVMRPFDSAVHDGMFRDESEGITWCTNLFKAIITKGENIDVGTEKPIKVGTNYESRIKGCTEIEIYAADKKDPIYTMETKVRRLTTLSVKHTESPEYYLAREKPIELVVTFGGTELKFKAKSGKTDQWTETTVSFQGH